MLGPPDQRFPHPIRGPSAGRAGPEPETTVYGRTGRLGRRKAGRRARFMGPVNRTNGGAGGSSCYTVRKPVTGEPAISLTTDQHVEREYDRLRQMAARHLRGETGGHLHPTVLVHEAYLRVAQSETFWVDRRHFLATAALAMSHVLVDLARKRRAGKRCPPGQRVSLSGVGPEATPDVHVADLLSLSEALAEMEAVDPQQFRITSLYFFGGLPTGEIATELNLTERQVRNELSHAKAMLLDRLEPPE